MSLEVFSANRRGIKPHPVSAENLVIAAGGKFSNEALSRKPPAQHYPGAAMTRMYRHDNIPLDETAINELVGHFEPCPQTNQEPVDNRKAPLRLHLRNSDSAIDGPRVEYQSCGFEHDEIQPINYGWRHPRGLQALHIEKATVQPVNNELAKRLEWKDGALTLTPEQALGRTVLIFAPSFFTMPARVFKQAFLEGREDSELLQGLELAHIRRRRATGQVAWAIATEQATK